jgi:hypothetical protein
MDIRSAVGIEMGAVSHNDVVIKVFATLNKGYDSSCW